MYSTVPSSYEAKCSTNYMKECSSSGFIENSSVARKMPKENCCLILLIRRISCLIATRSSRNMVSISVEILESGVGGILVASAQRVFQLGFQRRISTEECHQALKQTCKQVFRQTFRMLPCRDVRRLPEKSAIIILLYRSVIPEKPVSRILGRFGTRVLRFWRKSVRISERNTVALFLLIIASMFLVNTVSLLSRETAENEMLPIQVAYREIKPISGLAVQLCSFIL